MKKLLCIFFAFVLVSCAATKTVVLPNTHQAERDSVRTEYKHDSIYIDRWHTIQTVGDTTYIRDSVFVDRWHKLQLHDSIYISQTDTIYKTVEIEKSGSVFLRNSGIALWVIISLLVVGVAVGLIIKFAK